MILVHEGFTASLWSDREFLDKKLFPGENFPQNFNLLAEVFWKNLEIYKPTDSGQPFTLRMI